MVNYLQGKIYKIVSGDLTYIGSTCEPTLARRLSKHKENYKRWLIGKQNYMTSYKILENNDAEIFLLETFPCASKDELHARERFHIENNDCVNKNIPSRTKKEWYEENKDKLKEHGKSYREANKETIHKYKKEYYMDNKETIYKYQKEYYKENKEKKIEYQKEYYEENKIKRLVYIKKYNENNNDKIKAYKQAYYQKRKLKL